jgi:hypothetical protein
MTIDRRTFLRGCGALLALPAFESLSFAAPAAASRRLAFVFIPNGVHMSDWTPAATGADFALPYLLEPLAGVRGKTTVLTGLAHDKGRANGDGPGDHARSAAVFLTGAQPRKTAGSDIHAGVSVDQIAAQRMGLATRLPSLELGCEPERQSGGCDSGYSCAYSSNISWRTPRMPMLKEIDPRLVFERLFGAADGVAAEQRRAERKSVLDYVRDDAARLRGRLGGTDRRKLEEYFDGVRAVERRIEMVERMGAGEKPAGGIARPDGIPKAYAAHLDLMYALMALAFRADLTRVATFMAANEGSNRTYPEVGVHGGHHTLSHHGGDRAKIEQIRKINRFHMEAFGRFLASLDGVAEGEGSLLDHTTIVFGSGISDGNRHNHDDLPILVAGGGVGDGRHLRLAKETPMANLFLTLLDRFDVTLSRFGDSTGRLAGF